eukprot:2707502-Prorocentrum_lima.AAC.1
MSEKGGNPSLLQTSKMVDATIPEGEGYYPKGKYPRDSNTMPMGTISKQVSNQGKYCPAH